MKHKEYLGEAMMFKSAIKVQVKTEECQQKIDHVIKEDSAASPSKFNKKRKGQY